MAHTDFIPWTTGLALYAKPLPLVDPTWNADIIGGVENGSLGCYAFAGLSDTVDYWVYVAAAGVGNEANTDLAIGPLPKPSGHATLAKQNAILAMFSSTPSLSQPVAVGGQIASPIILGDDYHADDGRAFQWSVDPVAGFDLANAVAYFGLNDSCGNNATIAGTVTLVSDMWLLSFNIAQADTESLHDGIATWSVVVVDTVLGREVTRVRNDGDFYRAELVKRAVVIA